MRPSLGGMLLLCWALSACPPVPAPSDAGDPPPDGGLRCFASSPGAPKIEELRLLTQASHFPRALEFELQWSDPEGDLWGGEYQFTVQGTPAFKLPLPRHEELRKSAGTLVLPLQLPEADWSHGTQLQLELTLWDRKGNASNQPLLVMEVQR